MTKPLTNVGTHTGSYGATEWALTVTIGLIWGSAFLWIAMGVDHLSPQVVAFGRVVLGAAALALFPVARVRVAREDWMRLGIVAVVGNAGPALLFAVAETDLDSAVAGMITSGTPILSLAIASLMLRTLPPRTQAIGIGLGFAGIVLMTFPSLRGAEAAPMGVALVFLATIGYGLSGNLLVPLQQRYGGPAVTLWALAASAVLLAPGAALTIEESSFTTSSVVAVVILGVVGTGIARSLAATLAGRAGAPRMSTTTYLIPVVAIVLGIVVRDETVAPIAILGVAVVLSGAIIASRSIAGTKPGSGLRAPAEGTTGHVVLVGPMGAGKTTLGTAAAHTLDRPFLDSDSYLEEVTGQNARTLAQEHGLAHLHQKEKDFLITALSSATPAVVAAAASVSDDSELLSQVLTAGGTIIYLDRQDLRSNTEETPAHHRRPITPDEQVRLNRKRRQDTLGAGGHTLLVDHSDPPDETVAQLLHLLGQLE